MELKLRTNCRENEKKLESREEAEGAPPYHASISSTGCRTISPSFSLFFNTRDNPPSRRERSRSGLEWERPGGWKKTSRRFAIRRGGSSGTNQKESEFDARREPSRGLCIAYNRRVRARRCGFRCARVIITIFYARARSWSLFLNNEPHVVRDDDDAEGRSVDPK